MSANFFQTTQCNIPEDSHLETNHFKNLKSHLINISVHKRNWFVWDCFHSRNGEPFKYACCIIPLSLSTFNLCGYFECKNLLRLSLKGKVVPGA
jgi:hypothetical protein